FVDVVDDDERVGIRAAHELLEAAHLVPGDDDQENVPVPPGVKAAALQRSGAPIELVQHQVADPLRYVGDDDGRLRVGRAFLQQVHDPHGDEYRQEGVQSQLGAEGEARGQDDEAIRQQHGPARADAQVVVDEASA